MQRTVSGGITQLLRDLGTVADEGKRAVRLASRTLKKTRGDMHSRLLANAYARECLRNMGGVCCRLPGPPSQGNCIRELCKRFFSTPCALAAHKQKSHGRAGIAAGFLGSRCQVCGTEFWTTKRLQMHLRKNPKCLTVCMESDVGSVEWERVSVVSVGKSGQRPAVKTAGPAPFWTLLRPVEHEPQHDTDTEVAVDSDAAVQSIGNELVTCESFKDVFLLFLSWALHASIDRNCLLQAARRAPDAASYDALQAVYLSWQLAVLVKSHGSGRVSGSRFRAAVEGGHLILAPRSSQCGMLGRRFDGARRLL